MKKVILFFVVAMAFASCGGKKTDAAAPSTDSLATVVDSAATADSTAADTAKVDSVK